MLSVASVLVCSMHVLAVLLAAATTNDSKTTIQLIGNHFALLPSNLHHWRLHADLYYDTCALVGAFPVRTQEGKASLERWRGQRGSWS